jgi:hypothetical protein
MMIPNFRPGGEQAALVRLSHADQILEARMQAAEAAAKLGHALGAWRSGWLVADDQALCLRCRRAVFLSYGPRALTLLGGLRRSGTALQMRCDPPQGVR